MRQRLNMIVLGVRDVLSSVAFYEALGWKRSTAGSDEFALFDLGGVAIALLSRQAFADDARLTDRGTGGFAGFALGYIAHSPEDVYRIIAKAEELGAVVTQPVKTTPWGHNGYFTDPDGHLIEVLYEDGWKFDSHDNLVLWAGQGGNIRVCGAPAPRRVRMAFHHDGGTARLWCHITKSSKRSNASQPMSTLDADCPSGRKTIVRGERAAIPHAMPGLWRRLCPQSFGHPYGLS